MESDTDHIAIYNMNHTLFKNILIPINNVGFTYYQVQYVSEELFNTNAADVEYTFIYADFSSVIHFRIIDESGNILFARDTFAFGGIQGDGFAQFNIAYTTNGVKMLLRKYSGSSEVYSLPGILSCNECSSGVISGIAPTNSNGTIQQAMPLPYPNPTNSTTTINYQLPASATTGEMVFYDLTGREVKRVTVTRAFTSVLITAADLAAGTYYYELQTNVGVVPGNKIIVQ